MLDKIELAVWLQNSSNFQQRGVNFLNRAQCVGDDDAICRTRVNRQRLRSLFKKVKRKILGIFRQLFRVAKSVGRIDANYVPNMRAVVKRQIESRTNANLNNIATSRRYDLLTLLGLLGKSRDPLIKGMTLLSKEWIGSFLVLVHHFCDLFVR